MATNADKPGRWKADIAASVDRFNQWFMKFAPQAFRETRAATTKQVLQAMKLTSDLRSIGPATLSEHPEVLPILRMATAPPIARDRLIGLAQVKASAVHRLENGLLPARMTDEELNASLVRICSTIATLLDRDIFPWLAAGNGPKGADRKRASTIVADRLCGAVSDPIVRNAQEQRQLELIERFLISLGYEKQAKAAWKSLQEMPPGKFIFRHNVVVGDELKVNIPVDVVVQPKLARPGGIPILIEAKSAGDFTNTNKRRKEEATKVHQLRAAYGKGVQFILFLCGYFDSGYLGYEAAEGIDWVWEHRIEDLRQFGI